MNTHEYAYPQQYAGAPQQGAYPPQYAGAWQPAYMPQQAEQSPQYYNNNPAVYYQQAAAANPYAGSYSPGQAYPAADTFNPGNAGPEWGALLGQIDDPPNPWAQPAQAQPLPAESLSPPAGKRRKLHSMVFDILFCLLVLSIVGGSVLFAFSSNPQKSYFGYRLYTVKTPSMVPKADGSSPPGGFGAGALILIKLCEPETIQVGDIVTYVPGREANVYLTHRVVEILDHMNEDQGLFFVTRGDANDSDDPPIASKAVVGKKVFAIPAVGLILEFIRGNYILSLVTILSAFGFIILLRMYLSGPSVKKKKMAA